LVVTDVFVPFSKIWQTYTSTCIIGTGTFHAAVFTYLNTAKMTAY